MDNIEITPTGLVRDEGTLVLFAGITVETGQEVTFACEHRYAQAIIEAIEFVEDPVVAVPDYMIVSH